MDDDDGDDDDGEDDDDDDDDDEEEERVDRQLPYRKLCMLLVSQSRFSWKNTKPRDFVVRGRWRMIIMSIVVMMMMVMMMMILFIGEMVPLMTSSEI